MKNKWNCVSLSSSLPSCKIKQVTNSTKKVTLSVIMKITEKLINSSWLVPTWLNLISCVRNFITIALALLWRYLNKVWIQNKTVTFLVIIMNKYTYSTDIQRKYSLCLLPCSNKVSINFVNSSKSRKSPVIDLNRQNTNNC